MSDADLEQTLRELEQQFWANAGDAAFYREQLAVACGRALPVERELDHASASGIGVC